VGESRATGFFELAGFSQFGLQAGLFELAGFSQSGLQAGLPVWIIL
jgi:hypothetical protein